MFVVRGALDQWQVAAAVHRVAIRIVIPQHSGHQLRHMRPSVGITGTKEIRFRDHEVRDLRSYLTFDPGYEGIYPQADCHTHFVECAYSAREIRKLDWIGYVVSALHGICPTGMLRIEAIAAGVQNVG